MRLESYDKNDRKLINCSRLPELTRKQSALQSLRSPPTALAKNGQFVRLGCQRISGEGFPPTDQQSILSCKVLAINSEAIYNGKESGSFNGANCSLQQKILISR